MEGLARGNEQEKEIRESGLKREKVKLFLFADDYDLVHRKV